MAEHIEVLRIELVNTQGGDNSDNTEVGNLLKNKKTAKPLSYTEQVEANKLTKTALKDTAITPLPTASDITASSAPSITKAGAVKALGVGFSAASFGVSLASQYISDTQSLSGATHAAERTQKTVNAGLFATGLAVSVASGQYWATALMLAGRAIQYGLENRKEIFKMKLDKTVSALRQERLVKDTTHRLSNTK